MTAWVYDVSASELVHRAATVGAQKPLLAARVRPKKVPGPMPAARPPLGRPAPPVRSPLR